MIYVSKMTGKGILFDKMVKILSDIFSTILLIEGKTCSLAFDFYHIAKKNLSESELDM